jgi:uncharacterized membrane protein YoaK (UPF0700 family)
VVDAASVLDLGHVFTANMTGNIVFLGFRLAGHGTTSVTASLLAFGSFTAGALVGGRVTKAPTPSALKAAFSIEVATLLLAAALAFVAARDATFGIVGLLAFAMGLRNAVIRKLAIPDMTTTVLTLTVTGLAADSSLAGGTDPRWPRRVLAVLAMLAGAALGAALLRVGIAWVVGLAAALEVIAVGLLVARPDSLERGRVAPAH